MQLVFALRSLAGSGALRHPTLHRAEQVFGWALVTIAVYVFNGINDRTADQVNGSHRPIASGRLTISKALLSCGVFAVAGTMLCAMTNWVELALALAMLVLGWAYSSGPCLKNAPAGFAIVIGAAAALTYTAGWLTRDRLEAYDVVLAIAISIWVAVCCASKDFSDVPGDKIAGRRTWPVTMGTRKAAWLVASLALSASGTLLIVTLCTAMNPLPSIVLCTGSIAVAVTAVHNASANHRHARRRSYRAFLGTQLLTNIAFIVTEAG